jgi:hypothetical protein
LRAAALLLVSWLRRALSSLGFSMFVRRTWLRALGGFFIATVVLAACYWPVSVLQSWRIADLASATRTWPSGTILNDVIVEAQTKCSDSELTYVLVLLPPKSNASTLAERAAKAKLETDRLRERLNPIHFVMVDKDGTRTVSHTVPVDEFVRIYSSDEERLATLEARGTIPCDSASYLRADSLTVTATERPYSQEK